MLDEFFPIFSGQSYENFQLNTYLVFLREEVPANLTKIICIPLSFAKKLEIFLGWIFLILNLSRVDNSTPLGLHEKFSI